MEGGQGGAVVRLPTLLLSVCFFPGCLGFSLVALVSSNFLIKISFLFELVSLRLHSSRTQCFRCCCPDGISWCHTCWVHWTSCCVCCSNNHPVVFLTYWRETCRMLCNTFWSLMDVPSSWIRWNNYNLYPDITILHWWVIVSFIEF